MARAKINRQAVQAPVERAFRQTMLLLGRSFTEVISDPGAFSDFPGDIVDTGRLRASQQVQFPEPGKARFSWNADYAVYVLKGYTKRNGQRQPGRDWVAEGLKRSRVADTFKEQIRKELS